MPTLRNSSVVTLRVPEEGDDVVFSNRVAWTRGSGCLALAETLTDGEPIPLKDDLKRSSIAHRVEYLVTKKLMSFDLVPTIVPVDLDMDAIESVTAAVADGPHSPLAVDVAVQVGSKRGLPVTIATAYHANEDQSVAERRLDRLTSGVTRTHVERITLASDSASAIVDTLSPTTLLVIGAPGGSWFQRQLFGPGHKLLVAAPAGAVLVRSAPRRCFMDAQDATSVALSHHLAVGEARRVISAETVPVVDEGRLIGILRRRSLEDSQDSVLIAALMEPAVSVAADEPIETATDLESFLNGGPIPVIDDDHRLIGVLRP